MKKINLPFLRRRDGGRTDGTMSLMEHLHELRRRLFYAAIGIFGGMVVGFIWYSVSIPALGLEPLGQILIDPYCAVPSPPREQFGSQECSLLATTPFSALQIRLKASILAGSVISSPIWLYQLWSFVTPALYDKERRFAVTFVTSAAVLFVGGAVLAYVVVAEGLQVLLGFSGDYVTAGLDPDKYFTFLIAMLIIFGLSFELPLLLVMLNFAGILPAEKMRKNRRYAIFGMVVLSAFVVPGNDPITMLALAVSLSILYELAVQITRIHDKRKAKRLAAAGMAALSDDEASPLPPAPVADPPPISPAAMAPTSSATPHRPVPLGDPDPLGEAT